MVYLLVLYAPLKRWVLGLNDWLVAADRRLWGFVAAILALPFVLMAFGAALGPLAS